MRVKGDTRLMTWTLAKMLVGILDVAVGVIVLSMLRDQMRPDLLVGILGLHTKVLDR